MKGSIGTSMGGSLRYTHPPKVRIPPILLTWVLERRGAWRAKIVRTLPNGGPQALWVGPASTDRETAKATLARELERRRLVINPRTGFLNHRKRFLSHPLLDQPSNQSESEKS